MAVGSTSPEGIWLFGEDDSGATMSDLLNIGQTHTRTTVGTMQNQIAALSTAPVAWAAWNPTLQSGWTLGNGTLTGFAQVNGKTVDWRFELTFGSTTAITGPPTILLPYARRAAAGTVGLVGDVLWYDTSATARRPGSATMATNGSQACQFILYDGSVPTATTPWTWAVGDQVVATGRYERS
jgi:hypothetical protein